MSNTFNAVNEQTARGSATPVYDDLGNLTDNDEDQKYLYDAWGRLVQVTNQSNFVISQHRYNGLGYRIAWQYDLDADGGVEPTNSNDDPWLYQVHDSSWRVVATVFAVDDGAGTEAGEPLAKSDDEPRSPVPACFARHPSPGARGEGAGGEQNPSPATRTRRPLPQGERLRRRSGEGAERIKVGAERSLHPAPPSNGLATLSSPRRVFGLAVEMVRKRLPVEMRPHGARA